MARVAHIFRHPLKAIGAEELGEATLEAGCALQGDRVWAVAHAAARAGEGWSPCANFVRGAKSPALMAIRARTDAASGRITLNHPDRQEIAIDPETDGAALIDWLRPLCDPDRPAPARLVRAGARGMTDSDFPSVSILGLSSLRALEGRAGRRLDMRRFRGNIWLEGTGPWEEFEWVGKTLRIGDAELAVRERITRCTATTVDPETGRRDVDTLGALERGWGHQDLGVNAEVTKSGRVAPGDAAVLL